MLDSLLVCQVSWPLLGERLNSRWLLGWLKSQGLLGDVLAALEGYLGLLLESVLELSWRRSGSSRAHHRNQLGAKRVPNGGQEAWEQSFRRTPARNAETTQIKYNTKEFNDFCGCCGFFLKLKLLQNLVSELLEAPSSNFSPLGSFPKALEDVLERSCKLLGHSWKALGVAKGRRGNSSGLGESSRRAQGERRARG